MAKSAQEAIQNLSQRMQNPDGLSDGQVRNRRVVYPKPPEREPKEPTQLRIDELFNLVTCDICSGYEFNPKIKAVIRYFLGDQAFGEGVVSNVPDLKKGLFVYGTYGTGKSMIFKIIHEIGRRLVLEYRIKSLWFTSITAPWLVEEYMKSTYSGYNGNFNFKSYARGTLYIDDLGMEHLAFGRQDVVGELLFERHRHWINALEDESTVPVKTFISSNLSPKEFMQKYGPRLGDRLHESYNIIEFTGKSYRE